MLNYTIIIPHKNSVNLLKRLLASIPDYSDIEVIVIDNNSKEEEMHALQEMEINSNVFIYHDSSNLGAGRARNIGLSKARGKWLIFADADDFFSPNMYELISDYKDSLSDIVYFDTYSIYSDSNEEAYRHQRYSTLVNNFLLHGKEDALRYYFTPPWSKMIRRSLIVENKLKFDEVIASNDIYFSITVANAAKEISAVNKVLYIISVTAGSLTNSFSKKHFDDRFSVALKANDFLRSIGKSKYQLSVLYYIMRSYKFGYRYMFYVLRMLTKHKSNVFIGLGNVLKYKNVMKDRENTKYLNIKKQ